MPGATFKDIDDSNYDTALRVLAESFHDDAVINWSCDNPDSLIPFFEITLPPFLPHGLSYLDSNGRGIAVWLGPKQKLKWEFSLKNIANVFKIGGPKVLYRMMRSALTTEKYHPKTPHYYLFAIGVVPQCKGQGLGTSLIREVLKKCDEEGVPAYLENSKEENLRFYQGHGFKVIREIKFAPSAPTLWLMWRDPVTPAV
ncbi:MAG: hypothetical protein ACI9JM_000472 [Halioglobus sp.]|jgi:hypothetical protein